MIQVLHPATDVLDERERLVLGAWVEGDPIAQPRPKARAFAGHAQVYMPGTAQPWRDRISLALQAARPAEPLDGPLKVEVWFFLRRPKGHYRKNGELKSSAPRRPTTKPDFDNLVKAVTDELTQLSVWGDDGQVVWSVVQKRYADGGRPPGAQIDVSILEID